MSPARRFLYENEPILYAFGNTPAEDLLGLEA
jgi:hypothetical protein